MIDRIDSMQHEIEFIGEIKVYNYYAKQLVPMIKHALDYREPRENSTLGNGEWSFLTFISFNTSFYCKQVLSLIPSFCRSV